MNTRALQLDAKLREEKRARQLLCEAVDVLDVEDPTGSRILRQLDRCLDSRGGRRRRHPGPALFFHGKHAFVKENNLHQSISQLRARLGLAPPIYQVRELEPWSRVPERRQALVQLTP